MGEVCAIICVHVSMCLHVSVWVGLCLCRVCKCVRYVCMHVFVCGGVVRGV